MTVIYRQDKDAERCAQARRNILSAGSDWTVMLKEATTLWHHGDGDDKAFAVKVFDAYDRYHGDTVHDVLVRNRRSWWQLAVAVAVGVAFGLFLMGVN